MLMELKQVSSLRNRFAQFAKSKIPRRDATEPESPTQARRGAKVLVPEAFGREEEMKLPPEVIAAQQTSSVTRRGRARGKAHTTGPQVRRNSNVSYVQALALVQMKMVLAQKRFEDSMLDKAMIDSLIEQVRAGECTVSFDDDHVERHMTQHLLCLRRPRDNAILVWLCEWKISEGPELRCRLPGRTALPYSTLDLDIANTINRDLGWLIKKEQVQFEGQSVACVQSMTEIPPTTYRRVIQHAVLPEGVPWPLGPCKVIQAAMTNEMASSLELTGLRIWLRRLCSLDSFAEHRHNSVHVFAFVPEEMVMLTSENNDLETLVRPWARAIKEQVFELAGWQ